MLDDDTGRFVKDFDALQGGVGVSDVIVGKSFALKLLVICNSARQQRAGFTIKCGGLMRVFAVSHFVHLVKSQSQRVWQLLMSPKIPCHSGIVLGRMAKRFYGIGTAHGCVNPVAL